MRPNLLLPPRMRLQATSLLLLQPRGSYPRLAALPVFSRGSSFLTGATKHCLLGSQTAISLAAVASDTMGMIP